MMYDALRLLREEHELQANVVRKMDERVVLFENQRARDERERERSEREVRERAREMREIGEREGEKRER